MPKYSILKLFPNGSNEVLADVITKDEQEAITHFQKSFPINNSGYEKLADGISLTVAENFNTV